MLFLESYKFSVFTGCVSTRIVCGLSFSIDSDCLILMLSFHRYFFHRWCWGSQPRFSLVTFWGFADYFRISFEEGVGHGRWFWCWCCSWSVRWGSGSCWPISLRRLTFLHCIFVALCQRSLVCIYTGLLGAPVVCVYLFPNDAVLLGRLETGQCQSPSGFLRTSALSGVGAVVAVSRSTAGNLVGLCWSISLGPYLPSPHFRILLLYTQHIDTNSK